MRRLITFACDGDRLGGSLDPGQRRTGLLLVTGGTQTRVGAHRMLHALAQAATAQGFPAFRFDRRGVGDSSGDDPGYRNSGPDLAAALAAFRRGQPDLKRVVAFGLCDGATALALNASVLRPEALVLANPWLVETSEGEPAPAALRSHYRDRLFDPKAWGRLFKGGVNLHALARSARRSAASTRGGSLAEMVARGLGAVSCPITLVLSTGDNTARAARACWAGPAYAQVARRAEVVEIATDAHTFARSGDGEHLAQAVLAVLEGVDARA